MKNSEAKDDVFFEAGHVPILEVADVFADERTELVAVESDRMKLLLKFFHQSTENKFNWNWNFCFTISIDTAVGLTVVNITIMFYLL